MDKMPKAYVNFNIQSPKTRLNFNDDHIDWGETD